MAMASSTHGHPWCERTNRVSGQYSAARSMVMGLPHSLGYRPPDVPRLHAERNVELAAERVVGEVVGVVERTIPAVGVQEEPDDPRLGQPRAHLPHAPHARVGEGYRQRDEPAGKAVDQL